MTTYQSKSNVCPREGGACRTIQQKSTADITEWVSVEQGHQARMNPKKQECLVNSREKKEERTTMKSAAAIIPEREEQGWEAAARQTGREALRAPEGKGHKHSCRLINLSDWLFSQAIWAANYSSSARTCCQKSFICNAHLYLNSGMRLDTTLLFQIQLKIRYIQTN